MAENESRRALFSRRRRANVDGGRQHFHKVGVSPEEEGALVRLAHEQNVTIPRLLVEAARKQAVAELFKLHRLLAAISNNVNQIARATNATGEVQDEVRATLDAVRRTAVRIDDAVDRMAS